MRKHRKASKARKTAAAASGREGPRSAGNAAAAAAVAADAPREVLRGANKAGVTLDWIRVSLPAASRENAVRMLDGWLGESKAGKGGFFHSFSLCWGSARLFWSTDADRCIVDIPGTVLASLDAGERMGVLEQLLGYGGRCTRLDIALDFRGEGVTLLADLWESIERGELCVAKVFERVTGSKIDMVRIGRRGSMGSGRFVRVYDKGLETGEEEAGCWIRWEAELSEDIAAETALRLCREDRDVERSHGEAAAIALGCVDLREVTPGETALARRPRVRWFAALAEAVGAVLVRVPRRLTTLAGKVRWLKRCVLPELRTLAEAHALTLDELTRAICGRVATKAEYLARDFGREVGWMLAGKAAPV